MRRIPFVLVFLALVAAIAPASAVPATPEQRIAKLERQVKKLNTQVKTLQTQNTNLARALGANFVADACLAAQTADLVQSTWTVIDQIAQSLTTPRTYFGPQTAVNDYNTCGNLLNPAVPRQSIRTPPVISFLQTLLDWFGAE
jgi:hypothetical protein